MAEHDENVGFEEGMPWLPTSAIDDACHDLSKEEHLRNRRHQQHRHNLNLPTTQPLLPLPSKCRLKAAAHERARHPTNWAAGGPGMQAIFLDSGQKSGGTGVFLPRTAGTNFQLNNKPAYSPVLLPSRVVQALKLDVHEPCLQIKHRDLNNKSKGMDHNNKKGSNVTSQSCVISQNRSSSPDIFLPKEWSY